MTEVVSTPGSHSGHHQWIGQRYNGDLYESSETGGTVAWTDTREGESNSRWRQNIRAGSQAATVMNGERLTYSARPFLLSTWNAANPPSYLQHLFQYQTAWGVYHPSIPSSPAGLSEGVANNRALELLVRKIRDAQTTFSGGVAAGEFIQTVKLLSRPAHALHDLFINDTRSLERWMRRMKHLPRKQRIKEYLNIATDWWLTFQLGAAPLLADIDSAAEAVANSRYASEYYRPRKIVRAVGVDESCAHSPNLSSVPSTATNRMYVDSRKYTRVSVRYIACVDAGTQALASYRRLGIDASNFLPTVWELLPWSFVIDYFSNIGDVISAASLSTSSIRWVVKTTRREYEHTYIVGSKILLPSETSLAKWRVSSKVPGKTVIKRTNVTRIPYYGSLVPSLQFELPGMATQWLNMAALLYRRDKIQSYMT